MSKSGVAPWLDSLPVPPSEWRWFGSPAHLIVGEDCRFHLATVIGPWLISTVGEWLPDEGSREITANVRGIVLEGRGDARRADYMRKIGYQEIGAGRKYETMVFRVTGEVCTADDCDCGLPVVAEWGELDSDGYNQRGEAHRGHYAMCETWASRAASSQQIPGDAA